MGRGWSLDLEAATLHISSYLYLFSTWSQVMWLESRVKKSDFEHLKDRWTACLIFLIQKQRHRTKLSQVTGRSGATGRSISGCLANPCIFLEIPHIRHPSSNFESRRYWRYCICEVIAVKHCKTPVSYPTPVFCDFCGRHGCLWSVLGRSGIQGMPGFWWFCSLEKHGPSVAKSMYFRVFRELHLASSGNDTCATHWVSVHVSVSWTLGCVLAKQVLITGDADIAARVCRLSCDCSTLHTMCEACSCESLH